ncbi:MAG: TSUP family transporter [Planctomycetes bacterium]|nr:TSUP family transporter [Planctomycetota bacterium]
MTPLAFMLITFVIAVLAGVFGAMFGLGGGVIVVPALTLLMGIDIRYAIGASIISVIATSSGAGAAYVKEHLTNFRLAMYLEMGTTIGALIGATVAGLVETRWLTIIFAALLTYTAFAMWLHGRDEPEASPKLDGLSRRLDLRGSYYDPAIGSQVEYQVNRTPLGLFMSIFAGIASGLLGIGGGTIKVPTMNMLMGVPLKASSATSNFMIGVTAAASAGVYFARGDIDPFITAPVLVGVLVGSTLGAKVMRRTRSSLLRAAFSVVLVIVAARLFMGALK